MARKGVPTQDAYTSTMIAGERNRVAKLAKELGEHGADAFFAWHPVSMTYLNGFGEGAHERFLTLAVKLSGETALICPALSATQAKRSGIADIRSWKDGEDPLNLFRSLADEWDLRSGILLVDDEMPAHMLLRMQEALPAALFKAGGDVISDLMRVKDADELRLMQRAADMADQALAPALRQLRPGMTELEFDEILRNEMQKLGGRPTFCIVATGANSAEPHHGSDDTPIKEGDVVLLDYGCSLEGYNSDTTRVVGLGRVPEEAHKVYGVVMRAQQAGRDAIRAGVPAQEIDRACRKVIEEAGYGEYFIHRTGHGIGLKGHEEPFIVEGASRPLQEGECFSVEPGIYLPGKFGVRIENIVTPTLEGHISFNEEPSDHLIEVPV